MDNVWFECKIRYEKVMENGTSKKVTESYLVDALSFIEAESRIIKEATPLISGEFTVSDIRRANYSELLLNDGEAAGKWYDCKLEYISLDEKSLRGKRVKTSILVKAASLWGAMDKLGKYMAGTMTGYNALSIKETPLMGVFFHK